MKLNYDEVKPSNREIIVENKIVNPSLPSYIVELPSNGVFYKDKKEVKVVPFTIGQVRRLEAASKISNESNKEKEIANIVGDSLVDFNVFDLTEPDFVFLLYWIRLNSFQNNPYTIQWTYKTENGEDKKCISMVKTSNFEILECDRMLSPQFGYKTIRDRIEILELQTEEEKKYAEYAAILEGKSIQEKLARLDSLPIEKLFDLKTHLVKFKHGVSEYVKVRDEEVENSPWFNLELRIEVSDFFP